MRALSVLALAWTATAASLTLGCANRLDVECGLDSHCDLSSGGRCHEYSATGHRWCSYPDPECPSGQRYSDLDVGDGVSGACTEVAPARCDPTAEFGTPTLVPSINSGLDDDMTLANDELVAFVVRGSRIMTSVRAAVTDEFPSPDDDPDLAPIISADGVEFLFSTTTDRLVLYFQRQVNPDAPTLYVATRDDVGSVFDEGSLVHIGSAPLPAALLPRISQDGQTLYWQDYYEFDLRSATRRASVESFGEQSVASTFRASTPVLSADELTLYYSSSGNSDILSSTRIAKSLPFEPGIPVPNVNSSSLDLPAAISRDGCLLYLTSNRSGGIGGRDIWVARRSR